MTEKMEQQKKAVPNFSRPRQQSGDVQQINAFQENNNNNNNPPLPDEPRFSIDSAQTQIYAPLQKLPSNPTPPSTSSSEQKPLLKSILKSTTVEQHSSRASSGEDIRSHHTVSEEEGAGRKWSSSEADTSGLSEKEIEKLEKKGINPALYVEMQNAKKENGSGKGLLSVGRLTGNAYV